MFQTPSSHFLAAVPTFFTQASFENPKRLVLPRPREDWLSFPTLGRAGSGDFARFRHSPQFQAVQQQFLERIEQCKAFAQEHFTYPEADLVLTGLDTFAQRLTLSDGMAHFRDSLEPLYGLGKRHFDSFCTRLAQDSADLEDRKNALRELASQLRECGNVCPALHEAALRLNSDPAGLHGEFHDVLMARIDALLQEAVSHPPTDAPPHLRSQTRWAQWLQSHEMHVVQRLKLALDLPVGPLDDAIRTRADLITGDMLVHAHCVLRHCLHPVALAEDLAERYMTRLKEEAHPGQRLRRQDLSQLMPFIRQAHAKLSATYGNIPLQHLVMEDAQTRQTFWQEDLSRVTRDLLKALAQKGLIVEQRKSFLQSGYDDHASWEVSHINWQLFIVKEYRQGSSTRQAVPPTVAHVLSIRKHWRGHTPPAALIEAVIRGNRPKDLMQVAPSWLTDTEICATFCRAMDDDGMRNWIARHQPIGQTQVRLLLPVLTRAGLHKALAQLMQGAEGASAQDWFNWGGGRALLARVVGVERTMGLLMYTAPSPEVERLWIDILQQALPALSDAETQDMFRLGERSLVEEVAKVGRLASLRHVMALLSAAATVGRVSGTTLQALAAIPMQSLMNSAKLDVLEAHGDALMDLANKGLLPAGSLPTLMEGAWAKDFGCSGALQAGQVETVDWFHRRVRLHHSAGHLTDEQAATLLRSSPQVCDSGAVLALANGHAQALYAQMSQLQHAVSVGMLPREELPDLLAFRDMQGTPGFEIMLTDPKAGACLDRWTLALKEAKRCTHLTPEQLSTLLAAYDSTGQPLLARLIARQDGLERAKTWLQPIKALSGSLPPGGVVRLLEGHSDPAKPPRSLLFTQMLKPGDPGPVTTLIELYGVAHQQALLSDDELARLLVLRQPEGEAKVEALLAPGNKAGTSLRAYLVGLLHLGKHGRLMGHPLLRLLHGIATFHLSSVGKERDGAFRAVLEGLLDTSLSNVAQGRIPAAWWCRALLKAPRDAALNWSRTENILSAMMIMEPLMTEALTQRLLHGPLEAALQVQWTRLRASAGTRTAAPTATDTGTARTSDTATPSKHTPSKHTPPKPTPPQPRPRLSRMAAGLSAAQARPTPLTERTPPPVPPRRTVPALPERP